MSNVDGDSVVKVNGADARGAAVPAHTVPPPLLHVTPASVRDGQAVPVRGPLSPPNSFTPGGARVAASAGGSPPPAPPAPPAPPRGAGAAPAGAGSPPPAPPAPPHGATLRPPGHGLPPLPPGYTYAYVQAPPAEFYPPAYGRAPPPFFVVGGVATTTAEAIAADEARNRECVAAALTLFGIFFIVPAALCVCAFSTDRSPRVRRWAQASAVLCLVYVILAIVFAVNGGVRGWF